MRNLVRKLTAFGYHDDIATMQRKMLRDVPHIHAHRQAAKQWHRYLQGIVRDSRELIAANYGYAEAFKSVMRPASDFEIKRNYR